MIFFWLKIYTSVGYSITRCSREGRALVMVNGYSLAKWRHIQVFNVLIVVVSGGVCVGDGADSDIRSIHGHPLTIPTFYICTLFICPSFDN